MRAVLILAVLTLAACGADGVPLRPGATATSQTAPTAPATGVTLTGEAAVGVSSGTIP